jgi:hypothetical protein
VGQLGRIVGVVNGVEAGWEGLGAGRGVPVGVDEGRVVDDGVVAGVLAALVGELLALGVGNGFRGCVVCGCWTIGGSVCVPGFWTAGLAIRTKPIATAAAAIIPAGSKRRPALNSGRWPVFWADLR